ncbi:MAG TPA: DUF4214 domain-containing protein [Pyrinomonadaceae bacterium]|nr:DUF4214 domain-containing protein [Pyrinomonadaceae bacterium]
MSSVSRRTIALAFSLLLVATLVLMPGLAGRQSPVNLAGSVASADASDPRSYVEFIDGAYLGALNRLPTCEEEQAEFDNLVYATANGNRIWEARRFASTLFETQASYNVEDTTTYCQTDEYELINPANCDVFVGTNSAGFITDLYEGFLLREPEPGGFNGWMSIIPTAGRKEVLRGFRDSVEFSILVNALYEGSRPDCGCFIDCPSGTTPDLDACMCRPCRDFSGGHEPLCP